MEWIYDNPLTTSMRRLGTTIRTIRYYTREGDEAPVRHAVTPARWEHSCILAALIRDGYDADRVEALLANRLADPADSGHAAEWEAFCRYRQEAKRLAFVAEREALAK